MKAWVAVLVLLVAVAAVVAVVLFVPGARAPKTPSPPNDAEYDVQIPPPPAMTVGLYLEALAKRDYQTAYRYLSRESKAKHSYDEFVSLNETKGITEYDVSTAKEQPSEEGYVTVTVQLKEDPAQAGIRVVKEWDAWKVVFIGGIPSYPYP